MHGAWGELPVQHRHSAHVGPHHEGLGHITKYFYNIFRCFVLFGSDYLSGGHWILDCTAGVRRLQSVEGTSHLLIHTNTQAYSLINSRLVIGTPTSHPLQRVLTAMKRKESY